MQDEITITAPVIGQPVGDDDGGLANPFLANIPEEDRPVVEKYIKDWDAGVTKKFQSYSDELNTYKEFGNADEIRTAMVIMQELSANPIEFIARTQEFVNNNPDLFKEFMMEQEPNTSDLSQYGDLPEEFVGRYSQTESQLQQLQAELADLKEEQTTKEQLQMLDSVIEDMHNTHGSFNDEYVIMKIAQGMSPEDAISEWQSVTEDIINSRTSPTAPRLLPGQGGTPLDQVDKSKLSDPTFRKEYGAELLRAQLGR